MYLMFYQSASTKHSLLSMVKKKILSYGSHHIPEITFIQEGIFQTREDAERFLSSIDANQAVRYYPVTYTYKTKGYNRLEDHYHKTIDIYRKSHIDVRIKSAKRCPYCKEWNTKENLYKQNENEDFSTWTSNCLYCGKDLRTQKQHDQSKYYKRKLEYLSQQLQKADMKKEVRSKHPYWIVNVHVIDRSL